MDYWVFVFNFSENICIRCQIPGVSRMQFYSVQYKSTFRFDVGALQNIFHPQSIKTFLSLIFATEYKHKKYKRQKSFFFCYDKNVLFPDFGILIKFWLKVWSWSNDQALTEFQSLLPLRSVGSSTSIWVANMGKHKVWKLLTIRGQIKKIWIWRMYLQLIHRV